ncbi:MAG: ATP-binding protein [Chitinophagaceae bacterium]
MQASFSEVSMLTIIITTLLLFFAGSVMVLFFFRYQKRRFQHKSEILQLRETFNHTLLQSKLEIQENTLDHIAKELHANFSHLVSLININLSSILPGSSPETRESIYETKSLAQQLMGELKALSVSLNTDYIMQIGFTTAMENELNRLNKTKKYKTSLTKKGEEKRLRPEYEIILFRLCQEILNNIVKHSEATSVSAVLEYTPAELVLEITDDGVGFNSTETALQRAEGGSTGLTNMQNRARLINAIFTISSKPGAGTSCKVAVPFDS